jgi:PIN domain nuclease of toxin-antitoxin system
MESNMPSVVRKSLAELVEEIIDVTPSPDMVDSQQANSYAIQVEAALARSRADTARQLSCDTDERE